MALSDKKLYCGDKEKKLITSTVNLYTDLKDVQNQGKAFNHNGQTLYAKYGDLTNGKASKLRCRVDGGEKALLTGASTQVQLIDDFNNKRQIKISESDFIDTAGGYLTIYSEMHPNDSRYNGYIKYDIDGTIPKEAQNIKLQVDLRSFDYKAVGLIYLMHTTYAIKHRYVYLEPRLINIDIKKEDDIKYIFIGASNNMTPSESATVTLIEANFIKLFYDIG